MDHGQLGARGDQACEASFGRPCGPRRGEQACAMGAPARGARPGRRGVRAHRRRSSRSAGAPALRIEYDGAPRAGGGQAAGALHNPRGRRRRRGARSLRAHPRCARRSHATHRAVRIMNRGRAWLDRLIAWSPVFLLGAFSALTYWLNAQVQPGGAAFDGSGRHDTDLYIEDFKAVSLDPQGHIRQSITARIARHFPDNDTTEFEAPLITFSEPGKPPISITADRGMITGDQQNAYFTGKVKGIREAAAGEQGRIIVTSEYLHVLPKEDKI